MSESGRGVDVLIVGSGPAGSTFVREIREAVPGATVVMVEAGPRLTTETGVNIRNLETRQRETAQRTAEKAAGLHGRCSETGQVNGLVAACPGMSLVGSPVVDGDGQAGMPAAAIACNVGGMGVHWTCACPKPGDSERIDFLGAEFDAAFDRACRLLNVTQEAFPETEGGLRLRTALSAMFDDGRAPDRRVQPMPLAARPRGDGRPEWSGTASLLDGLTGAEEGFTLRDETLCRRLLTHGEQVIGAELAHRPTGRVEIVKAQYVVVAGDALRTPQLLWASGIRPAALGRYLNDQPQLHSALIVHDKLLDEMPDGLHYEGADLRDDLVGVLWVPFHDPDLPYHTQVMLVGTGPTGAQTGTGVHRQVVGYGRFLAKDIRAEDRVEFSNVPDRNGMPTMTIHYDLTPRDRSNIDRALRLLTEEGRRLGSFLPGETPRLLPAGSSMHYQGSVRMAAIDDGTSVCDPTSRVWGTDNLYVAGNGVIPSATACNPTATAVALAVLAARSIVERLRA